MGHNRIAGFGKTTLINRLVKEELNGLDVLVIQFETGEEKLQKGVKLHKMIFSKSCLEENPFGITGRILKYVRKHRPELILIEWNGWNTFTGWRKCSPVLCQSGGKRGKGGLCSGRGGITI